VTGASSGIGWEIALQLVRAGSKVVAVARRNDRLGELTARAAAEGGLIVAVAGDITDPQTRQRALDAVQSTFGGLDILVNNAGAGAMGLFENATPERLRAVMEVNFFALAEMTRSALPMLKRGERPIVVNVGSVLGRRGAPHRSEYCASKFAVQGLSEAIRAEFAKIGVDVLQVNPGPTESEFHANLLERIDEPKQPRQAPTSAAEVARQTLKAIRLGRHEIVPSFWGRMFCLMSRHFPRLVDRLMVHQLT
jgi:short-subunit dehydrogenase